MADFKKLAKKICCISIVAVLVGGGITVALPQMTDSSITAEATYSNDYGLKWKEDEYGDVTITGYTGSGGEVVIPAEIDGKTVTSIGSSAFYDCTGLKSVTIPVSVTEIGSSAFDNCTGLTDVTIPDSVASIGENAFYGCTGLTGIVMPDSVTSMGNYAFANCTGLTNVLIPNSVTSIGANAFNGCTRLTKINVGVGNKYYSSNNGVLLDKGKERLLLCPQGFKGSYTVPNSVKHICTNSFISCTGLTGVTIPDSVTSIGNYAFSGCKGLTSITLPDSVTLICAEAFSSCTGLTSITIPDSVTSIDDRAFLNCTGLTSITIPDSVKEICSNTFAGCTKLTNVIIPDSVTSINESAFANCTGLKILGTSGTVAETFANDNNFVFVAIDGEGGKAITVDGFVWEENDHGGVTITSYIGDGGEVVIPSKIDGKSVTAIADNTFDGCKGLTNVTIPDGVTSIGFAAFRACPELTGVTIPNSVTSIGEYAFWHTGLKSVTIPDGVTLIANGTFGSCKELAKVTIPDSVKEIGNRAFFESTKLSNVIIPDGVTSIGFYAFCACEELTEITIPDSVTTIDQRAFVGCTGLTSINVSADNQYFSSNNGILLDKEQEELIRCPQGFKGSYTVPDSITLIRNEAFYGCKGLINVMIPHSVTEIGESAFESCTGLNKVMIPNSVTEIGSGAFAGCTGLTILGEVGSAAEIYAKENNILFVSIVGVTGVKLNKASVALEKGKTTTLTVIVTPNNATDKSVTWTSSNTKIATVSNGTVTGIGAGTATITVMTSNGESATCKVTVKKPVIVVTGIKLNKTSLNLEEGNTEKLKATITPSNATDKSVTWTSSNTKIATVSDGTVKCVGVGTATITAKTNNGMTATCNVTVKNTVNSTIIIVLAIAAVAVLLLVAVIVILRRRKKTDK